MWKGKVIILDLDLKKYFILLKAGKHKEAEVVRQESIPDRLIKFIWLDGSKKDEKKFLSLEQEQLWFSNIEKLNDPFEFKGMQLNKQKFVDAGYPQDIIEAYESVFDMKEYGVVSLSANDIDYLPMWAYYTNNYQGFCIEYNVIKKDCIHEVLYEPKRIQVASLLLDYKKAVEEAMLSGAKRTKAADTIGKILMQNLFIKAQTWKHEKEYRIAYQIDGLPGKNVEIRTLGMTTNKIIAGINCSEENIVRLNEISNKLGIGNVHRSKLSDIQYALDIVR